MRAPLHPPEFHMWELSDGYEARGRTWQPTAPHADTAILYLHGIQSHGGWFEWSASVMNEAGPGVVLPDRRGSGLNRDQAPGDVKTFQRWFDDLDEIAEEILRAWQVQRLAVCGVSWGGKLAAAWALQRPQRVDRLLLIAPGIAPAVDVGLATRIRIGAALLFEPTRLFEVPLSDPALFTGRPAAQTFITEDALKLTHATARFLFESARLDRRLRRAPARSLQPPTTLVLAGRDRIISNDPTERWLRRACAAELEVVRFPQAHHTVEFEDDESDFATALRGWATRDTLKRE